MTYEQELLARAMNHLDDGMIEAAHGKHKRLRRLVPWVAAAAVVVVMIRVYPYLRTVIETDGPPKGHGPAGDGVISEEVAETDESGMIITPANPDPDEPLAGIGIPVSLGSATLTLTEASDTHLTFTLVKTDDTPLYAALYGLRGDVLASTQPDYKEDGVLIRPYRLRIYTDGATEPAYELPAAPGTYEVVLDYTSIRNGSYPMQECVGFYAYIGKDGKPVTTRLSLSPATP